MDSIQIWVVLKFILWLHIYGNSLKFFLVICVYKGVNAEGNPKMN